MLSSSVVFGWNFVSFVYDSHFDGENDDYNVKNELMVSIQPTRK